MLENGAPSQETQTEVTTQETTEQQTTENTTQQTEQTTQAPQTIKVKFNHEEKEIPIEEAIILAQKGMNYDKGIERERQAGIDAYIAKQGYEWNGKPITTEKELNEAIKERDLREQYSKQELPEEVVNELVESRKFRETYQTQQEINEKKAWEDKEYKLFLDTYKDVKPEDIPASVWVEFNEGKSLVDAYAKHENTILKAKLAEYEKGQKATTANQVNAETSPGSVAGQGATGEGHISFDTFEANKHDQNWVKKNLEKIMESRAKW